MKYVTYLLIALYITGCAENEDGSSKSTYSSCKITSSQALFLSDRVNDLEQCWNAPENGYESQGDAMQWCEKKVTEYLADEYIFGHAVSYQIESTYCPQ